MGKHGSALSHVLYGHRCGPSQVALTCPHCGREAQASLPCSISGVHLIGDLSPEWSSTEWHVACLTCAYRAGPFDHRQMRDHAPLYFRMDDSGQDLWAWNRDHLRLLINVFSDSDVTDHPYARLVTYIPGHWKARASQYERLARRLLAT